MILIDKTQKPKVLAVEANPENADLGAGGMISRLIWEVDVYFVILSGSSRFPRLVFRLLQIIRAMFAASAYN